jgi:hypothetical protein
VARHSVVLQERLTAIFEFQRTVAHVKHLVAELDSSRGAPTAAVNDLCRSIERELSQLRQRALAIDLGITADLAGALSVLAGRSLGIALKIRGLTEGVQSLEFELDASLARTLAAAADAPPDPQPPGTPPDPQPPPAPGP